MRRITRHWFVKFTLSVALVAAGLMFRGAHVSAACAAPSTDFGTVTSTVTLPATGAYRIWSRIQIPSSANNNFLLDIDGGTCYTVGGNGSLTPNTWVWVDYQSGGAKITPTLNSGNRTVRMIGTSDGVLLDRVIFTQDTNCVPTGTGDNCANPPDTTAPATTVSAPANGAQVSGTVNVTATASDDSGAVSKVEFYVDGSLKGTDTASAYAYSWDTTAVANGSHTLTTKAYDAAGNVGTSGAISVTVQNGQANIVALAVGKSPVPQKTGDVVTSFTASITNQGTIAGVPGNVTYKIDGTIIGTVASTASLAAGANRTVTLAANWTATAGSHALSATVGTSTYSENFTVASPDTTAPTVSVTAPANGSTVSATIALTATSTDNSGGSGVASVAFSVDGTLIGNGTRSGTTSTYTLNWNSALTSNATHTISAVSTDAAGNRSTASTVTVTVTNQTATKPGDVNSDNKVNGIDISVVLSNWQGTNKTKTQGDLSGDHIVNGIDLSMVISNWSP